MAEKSFDSSQMVGFGGEAGGYPHLVNVVVEATDGIIKHAQIPFDSDRLKSRVSTLRMVRRDGEAHQYEPQTNTLYLSLCNKEGMSYSDEETIIFTIHELMHLVSFPEGEDSFGNIYFGFDEFFTEYLTSMVVSNIGGIKLESYFRDNVKGYFGNDSDIKFMRELSRKIGFPQLLNIYLSRDIGAANNLIGREVLEAMNGYCEYFERLSEVLGMSLKRVNEVLADPLFATQKETVDDHIETINTRIQQHETPRPTMYIIVLASALVFFYWLELLSQSSLNL